MKMTHEQAVHLKETFGDGALTGWLLVLADKEPPTDKVGILRFAAFLDEWAAALRAEQ